MDSATLSGTATPPRRRLTGRCACQVVFCGVSTEPGAHSGASLMPWAPSCPLCPHAAVMGARQKPIATLDPDGYQEGAYGFALQLDREQLGLLDAARRSGTRGAGITACWVSASVFQPATRVFASLQGKEGERRPREVLTYKSVQADVFRAPP